MRNRRRCIMRAGTVAPLVILFATGCVTAKKRVMTEEFRTRPIPSGEVHVMFAEPGDAIPETCVRVATLEGRRDTWFSGSDELVQKLRNEAGGLGANLVFMEAERGPSVFSEIAAMILGVANDPTTRDGLAVRCALPPELWTSRAAALSPDGPSAGPAGSG